MDEESTTERKFPLERVDFIPLVINLEFVFKAQSLLADWFVLCKDKCLNVLNS